MKITKKRAAILLAVVAAALAVIVIAVLAVRADRAASKYAFVTDCLDQIFISQLGWFNGELINPSPPPDEQANAAKRIYLCSNIFTYTSYSDETALGDVVRHLDYLCSSGREDEIRGNSQIFDLLTKLCFDPHNQDAAVTLRSLLPAY